MPLWPQMQLWPQRRNFCLKDTTFASKMQLQPQRHNYSLRDATTATKIQIWPSQCKFWLIDAKFVSDRQSWLQRNDSGSKKKTISPLETQETHSLETQFQPKRHSPGFRGFTPGRILALKAAFLASRTQS